MRMWTATGGVLATALLGLAIARMGPWTSSPAAPADERLREYSGAYAWQSGGFVYLQLWNEFTGTPELVAFDESGEVRTLYRERRDGFSAGARAAVRAPVESRIEFHRDGGGSIAGLTWRRTGRPPRTASRVDTERHEEVRFPSGSIQLEGTLIRPNTTAPRHPAVMLVHGSGAQDRRYVLPYARFLVRHGIAVLGYDKRGVGGSGGDWKTASFDELAGDVVAAFEYLKTRADIDATQIGLMGISQAGWIMPLAAVRAPGMAFLISISGAAIPAAETTLDHARHEMTASGVSSEDVEAVVALMRLQYEYARTGIGWDEYEAARRALVSRLGTPPDNFPERRDDPYWQMVRKLYFHDPLPTLQRLEVPTLALFGALDNNVLPERNKAAWDAALKSSPNRDYTLRVIPRANHLVLEAQVGNTAEIPTLQRFSPEYFEIVREWLARRVRGFGPIHPS